MFRREESCFLHKRRTKEGHADAVASGRQNGRERLGMIYPLAASHAFAVF